MKFVITFLLLLVSVLSFGQVDTLDAFVKSRKTGENYELYEQKIGVILNGKMTFNTIEVHNYFIPFIDHSKTGTIVLRLYDKKKRIFAIGEWNDDGGFQGSITYYDRKSKVVLTKNFDRVIITPIE